MRCLDNIEKGLINERLKQPVTCPARDYTRKLLAGSAGREWRVDIEVFLDQHREDICVEIWMLRRLYQDDCMREKTRLKGRLDPTTQEKDRRLWKKKTFVTSTARYFGALVTAGRGKISRKNAIMP